MEGKCACCKYYYVKEYGFGWCVKINGHVEPDSGSVCGYFEYR